MLRAALAVFFRSLGRLNDARTAELWNDIKANRRKRKEARRLRKLVRKVAQESPPDPPRPSSDTLAPDLEANLKREADEFAEMIRQYPPPVITSPVPQPEATPATGDATATTPPAP